MFCYQARVIAQLTEDQKLVIGAGIYIINKASEKIKERKEKKKLAEEQNKTKETQNTPLTKRESDRSISIRQENVGVGNPAQASAWVQKAEQETNNFNKIEYYNRALLADPSSIDTYFNRGAVFAEVEEYEKALADFKKYIEYRPDDPEGYNNKGYCEMMLERYQDAILDFGESLKFSNPNPNFVYNNRGWSYALSGRYKEAINDFDLALKIDPTLTEALFRKGWCLQQLGNHADAVLIFDQYIVKKPDDMSSWYYRGMSKAELGRHKEAILDFNKILLKEPSNTDALYSKTISNISLEKYSDAVEDLTKIIALNPNDSEAYNNRGYCKSKLSKYSDALTDFTKSIELKNNTPEFAYTNRGDAYFQLQMYEKALIDYKQALILAPNHSAAVVGKQKTEKVLGILVSNGKTKESTHLKRYALVIGNSAYQHTSALSNFPINDANDIEKRLKELDFKVKKITDVSRDVLESSLNQFAKEANGANLVTIFYAGHGIEYNGVNYLIPIDAKVNNLEDVQVEAISLEFVLDKLKQSRAEVNLVFLDACRNNPFKIWNDTKRANDPTVAKERAFLPPPALSPNVMVYYATQPKDVAGNGTNRNGNLTNGLLQNLYRGVELKEMWQNVTNTVFEKITTKTQLPYSAGTMLVDVVF